MRKLCSIFLIGILSLSLLSCSSKKEEIPEHLKGDVLDFSEDKESKSCIHEEDYSKLLVQVDSVINFFENKNIILEETDLNSENIPLFLTENFADKPLGRCNVVIRNNFEEGYYGFAITDFYDKSNPGHGYDYSEIPNLDYNIENHIGIEYLKEFYPELKFDYDLIQEKLTFNLKDYENSSFTVYYNCAELTIIPTIEGIDLDLTFNCSNL